MSTNNIPSKTPDDGEVTHNKNSEDIKIIPIITNNGR